MEAIMKNEKVKKLVAGASWDRDPDSVPDYDSLPA